MKTRSQETMPGATASMPTEKRSGLRVRQADFAKMVGVSKPTISGWVKRGLIDPPGPDGMLDPVAAARQVMRRGDPLRLRAPLLRQVAEPIANAQARAESLDDEIEGLRSDLREARQTVEALKREQAERWIRDEDLGKRLKHLHASIVSGFPGLAAAHERGRLRIELDCLIASCVWQFSGAELEAFRREIENDARGGA